MKNKRIIILLLVLAAGVWGTVIYRIFKTVQRQDYVQAQIPETKSDVLSSLSDTFSIVADYRDPFLGKRIINQIEKGTTNSVVKPKSVPVATVTKWPAISYSGIIRNKTNPKELALVRIDQKDFLMKAGDVMQGIELSKIFRDSIVVLYQKEKKVIIR